MKADPTSVCVIILAYGARTVQLQKVLSEVLEQRAGHVIIVANAVINQTHQMLAHLKAINPRRLEILVSDENLGSAGGYEIGLRAALKKSYDFFWLLDDDNLPQAGALSALLETFSVHQQGISKGELVLQSFRESLPEMMYFVHEHYQPPPPRPASFIGFHIFNLWRDFKAFFSTERRSCNVVLTERKDIIRLHSAPYGGLFFHRESSKKLGLPNPHFFLYADDMEYTLNFTSQGGNLFLVPESRIIDIDPVWNAMGGKSNNIYRRLMLLPAKTAYYEIRNRIYVGKKMFHGHPLMYLLNKWFYITLSALIALYYRRGHRFKLILRAVHDGERGLLGKRNFTNEI